MHWHGHCARNPHHRKTQTMTQREPSAASLAMSPTRAVRDAKKRMAPPPGQDDGRLGPAVRGRVFSPAHCTTTRSEGPWLISLVSVKRGPWGQVTQAPLEGESAQGTSAPPVSSGSGDRQPFGCCSAKWPSHHVSHVLRDGWKTTL